VLSHTRWCTIRRTLLFGDSGVVGGIHVLYFTRSCKAISAFSAPCRRPMRRGRLELRGRAAHHAPLLWLRVEASCSHQGDPPDDEEEAQTAPPAQKATQTAAADVVAARAVAAVVPSPDEAAEQTAARAVAAAVPSPDEAAEESAAAASAAACHEERCCARAVDPHWPPSLATAVHRLPSASSAARRPCPPTRLLSPVRT